MTLYDIACNYKYMNYVANAFAHRQTKKNKTVYIWNKTSCVKALFNDFPRLLKSLRLIVLKTK